MGRKTKSPENDLSAAIKKLLASNTHLTRTRARRAFLAASRRLLKSFPLLDKDGQEVRKPMGIRCPLCPCCFISWETFANHVSTQHWKMSLDSQLCRGCEQPAMMRSLGRHLAAVRKRGDLQAHIVQGASRADLNGKDEPALIRKNLIKITVTLKGNPASPRSKEDTPIEAIIDADPAMRKYRSWVKCKCTLPVRGEMYLLLPNRWAVDGLVLYTDTGYYTVKEIIGQVSSWRVSLEHSQAVQS